MSAITDFCPLSLQQLLTLPVYGSDMEAHDHTALYKLEVPGATWWIAQGGVIVNDGFAQITVENIDKAEDIIFFGVAEIHEREMGSFSVFEWMDAGLNVKLVPEFEPGSLVEISWAKRD